MGAEAVEHADTAGSGVLASILFLAAERRQRRPFNGDDGTELRADPTPVRT